MSRLSEILGVKEGQEFRYAETDMIYKVKEEYVYYKKGEMWTILIGMRIYLMIENPDKIYPIPEKPQLTEQQITAIKGRIAEGTPWAAMDKAGALYAYEEKPKLSRNEEYFYSDAECYPICCDLYDFITFENSPVYLPELVEGSEDK